MKSIKTYLLLAFGHAFPVILFAQFGQLDTTFDNDGVALYHFQGGWTHALDVEILSDGKVLVLGMTASNSEENSNVVLLKYEDSGELDTEFGNGGIVLFDYGGQDDLPYDMAILPDGRINVVGVAKDISVNWGTYYSFMVQFMQDGQLDSTFAQNGILYDGTKVENEKMRVFVLPDGKLLWCMNKDSFRILIGRFNADGSPDTSFGINGYLTQLVSFLGITNTAWELLPNGKIVLMANSVGDIFDSYRSFFIFSKEGGIIIDEFNAIFEPVYHNDVKYQNNKLLTVGSRFDKHFQEAKLACNQIKLDGHFDSTFAINGTNTIETGGKREMLNSLSIDPDGNLVAVGYDGGEFDSESVILRLNPTGQLDESFGENGQVKLNFSSKKDVAYSVAIDSKERVVAVGSSGDSLMIARLIASAYVEPPPPSPPVQETAFRCWPNPVGQVLNLEYGLPNKRIIQLQILDINGRWVADLISKMELGPGFYTTTLTINPGLPNGSYWIRFEAGAFKAEQKILLIK